MPGAFGSIQSSSTRSGFTSSAATRASSPSVASGDAIAFLLEIVFQQLGEGVLVLDYQDVGGLADISTLAFFGIGLRPLSGDFFAGDEEVDVFGDVGGVVADALDVLGDEEKMRARR